jgi:hypothetical protein
MISYQSDLCAISEEKVCYNEKITCCLNNNQANYCQASVCVALLPKQQWESCLNKNQANNGRVVKHIPVHPGEL